MRFFLFTTTLKANKGGYREAKLEKPASLDLKSFWLNQSPLPVQPHLFRFQVWAKVKHPDNYWYAATCNALLLSKRTVSLIEDAGVQLESWPAELVDRKTGAVVFAEGDYFMCRLYEFYPLFTPLAQEGHYTVYAYLPRHENYESAPPFCMNGPLGMGSVPVVREDLKDAMEAAGITGCQFQTPEQYTRDLLDSSPYDRQLVEAQLTAEGRTLDDLYAELATD